MYYIILEIIHKILEIFCINIKIVQKFKYRIPLFHLLMEEKRKSLLINFLIPSAITLFVLCAIFAMLVTPPKFIEILFVFFLISQVILGILIIIFSLKITKRATHFFIGLLILFWGILQIVSKYNSFFSLKELWPVYTCTAGITLFISGFYKYKKIKFGYFFPAATLFFMGIWFSLFTFKIIKKPFMEIVSVFGPVFGAILIILLFVFFLLQTKHKELIVMDEETGTFSDEEDAFMNIENNDDK